MKHLICKLKCKAVMTAARTRRILSGVTVKQNWARFGKQFSPTFV